MCGVIAGRQACLKALVLPNSHGLPVIHVHIPGRAVDIFLHAVGDGGVFFVADDGGIVVDVARVAVESGFFDDAPASQEVVDGEVVEVYRLSARAQEWLCQSVLA